MTAADKIAEARALIEPLTGHTPGPWRLHGRSIVVDGACDTYSGPVLGSIGRASDTHDEDGEGRRWWTRGDPERNAAMFAAAPALRDTVADLADLADAQAQENARLAQRIEALEEALRFYADPVIYQPHPHGPAFDRRDVSFVAVAALGDKQ